MGNSGQTDHVGGYEGQSLSGRIGRRAEGMSGKSGNNRVRRNAFWLAAIVLILLFVWLLSARQMCRRTEGPTASPTTLMLHCGAGIRPAAEALIQEFEAKSTVRIQATYAGSGRLLGQIAAHPTGDLFMPGAEQYVDKAIQQGLAVRGTKATVAYFIPVIFVQKGNPRNIQSLEDLARKGLRLGFGDERACAVGSKTLTLLHKNDIPYERLRENVVYKSGTVNELGLAIQLRNVDAVIVWDANARQFARHGDVVNIPLEKNAPSTIPIVLLKSSKHAEDATQFIDFVTSAAGRRILKAEGYTIPLSGY